MFNMPAREKISVFRGQRAERRDASAFTSGSRSGRLLLTREYVVCGYFSSQKTKGIAAAMKISSVHSLTFVLHYWREFTICKKMCVIFASFLLLEPALEARRRPRRADSARRVAMVTAGMKIDTRYF